jgi:hypothetical protein
LEIKITKDTASKKTDTKKPAKSTTEKKKAKTEKKEKKENSSIFDKDCNWLK